MSRNAFVLAVSLLLFSLPGALSAQESRTGWSPPSRAMPEMPRASEVDSRFMASVARWFDGSSDVTGVPVSRLRAVGEGASATGRVRFVRFTSGPLPVAAWSDRNGDGRSDLIVLYRGSSVALELIDVDYDGIADVMRVYDAAGALLRETRLR
jgi:hypothetical protein